jgi:hypothetical protein
VVFSQFAAGAEMTNPLIWAGTLTLILIHAESGCRHSALHAARLLEQLSETPELDDETRALCERASQRFASQGEFHARAA